MKLTISTAVFNQLEDTKVFWGNLIANVVDKENTELLVINNGSTDGTKEFIESFVFPHFPDHRIINHEENTGVVKSMQEIVDNAKGDVIAIVHNDLFICQYGFDQRIIAEFTLDPKLGLAGFLGAKGIGETGGRMNTVSNLLEAEIHGERVRTTTPVLQFDGLALIGRREMFAEVGGFDQQYTYHHFYDRDISMASHEKGWTNKVIPILCHHKSGITANRPDYQTWIDQKMGTQNFTGDLASYKKSEAYFIQKWHHRLPQLLA